MILKANGHEPDPDTFPPCSVILGGMVVRLTPPREGDNWLNARLAIDEN